MSGREMEAARTSPSPGDERALRVMIWMPVLNQVEELPEVLRQMRAIGPDYPFEHFLIVDNGSSDGSEKIIAECGFDYIRLEKNLGVGYSYLVAVEYALKNNYDVIGGLASNGKMLPSEMHRLITPLRRGEADYVTGSRYMKGGSSPNLPFFRLWAIPAVSVFLFFLGGRYITDSTCGYRALKLDIFRRAEFDWRASWLYRYGFENYIYAKALFSRQIKCIEVPITMKYPVRRDRQSKINGWRDWLDILRPFVVARFDGKWFRPANAAMHQTMEKEGA